MRLVCESLVQKTEVNLEDPEYRRATLSMAMATRACETALKKVPDLACDKLSFILATRVGELSSSLEFLETLQSTGAARPILFQNSLHNSTLGFLSTKLGFTGPTFSVCGEENQDEMVETLAQTMLEVTPAVVVCSVDVVPEKWHNSYLAIWPNLKLNQARCQVFGRY